MTGDAKQGADDESRDRLEALIAACIERMDEGDTASVTALLDREPALADRAREVLASLMHVGMVGADRVAPDLEGSLGEYRLLRRLGSGGMGTVYLARQESLGRLVAVKVAHAEADTTIEVERFRREARAIASLRHPNIVHVFGVGEVDGRHYLAMEYIPGRSLAEWMRSDPIPVPRALEWIRRIALALHVAHDKGIVHRDVKPTNILIDDRLRPLLVDFGLVREAGASELTRSGSFVGSPMYAAPEQIAGNAAIGPRSDVYSLGVTLYELVAGRPPFVGETTERLFHQILTATAPAIRELRRDVSRDLEVVIHRAIECDPAHRYASAAEFARDLEALLELRPIAARPPGLARRGSRFLRAHPVASTAGAVAALAIAAFLAVSLWQSAAEARRRRDLAREAMDRARGELAHVDSAGAPRAEDLAARRDRLALRYQPDEAWDALDRAAHALHVHTDRAETRLAGALRDLDRAEQLGAARASVDELRALVHLERWRLSRRAGERRASDYYRRQIERYDAAGRHRAELLGLGAVRFDSDPPGADVFLFRLVDRMQFDAEGESRLVPTPNREGDPPVAPGALCMRVWRDAPPLRESDLVVEVAGVPVDGAVVVVRGDGAGVEPGDLLATVDGVAVRSTEDASLRIVTKATSGGSVPGDGPESEVGFVGRDGRQVTRRCRHIRELGIGALDARSLAERGDVDAVVLRDGERVLLRLPHDPPLRATTSPLAMSPECHAASTPAEAIDLQEGPWIAVFRANERHHAVVPFDVVAGAETEVAADLIPVGGIPGGFVAITGRSEAVETPFFLQEHEVTFEQYLPFLNDPEIQAEIDASATPILYPRELDNARSVGFLAREADGRFVPRFPQQAKLPLPGVSYKDATAFVSWMNRRAEGVGAPWRFDLPTLAEVDHVRQASRYRAYPTGPSFRPHWFNGYFTGPEASLRPVFWTPQDEVPPGVFNLAGGVSEWVKDWYDEGNRLRVTIGGSWMSTDPHEFRLDHRGFLGEDTYANKWGFRLVARPR